MCIALRFAPSVDMWWPLTVCHNVLWNLFDLKSWDWKGLGCNTFGHRLLDGHRTSLCDIYVSRKMGKLKSTWILFGCYTSTFPCVWWNVLQNAATGLFVLASYLCAFMFTELLIECEASSWSDLALRLAMPLTISNKEVALLLCLQAPCVLYLGWMIMHCFVF